MRRKLFLLIIILAALTSACSPQVVKLTSVDEAEYYNGREIVSKEDDNASVTVEIDTYSGDEVVFYIEIENKSNEKMFIKPANFYVDALEADLYSFDKHLPRFYALNPEEQIERIDGDKNSRKTAHSVFTGINAITGLVSIVADLSDGNNYGKAENVANDIGNWAGNQIDEEIDYDASMNEYEYQKEFWKNEVLRTTDLYQNDFTGGLLFVPISNEAEYLKLTIPTEFGNYNFLYKKVIAD